MIELTIPAKTKAIIEAVCDYYGVTQTDLKSYSRKYNVTRARHMAMYILYTTTETTYDQIGEIFGGRDHSSVMHARQKIHQEIECYKPVEKEVKVLRDWVDRTQQAYLVRARIEA